MSGSIGGEDRERGYWSGKLGDWFGSSSLRFAWPRLYRKKMACLCVIDTGNAVQDSQTAIIETANAVKSVTLQKGQTRKQEKNVATVEVSGCRAVQDSQTAIVEIRIRAPEGRRMCAVSIRLS